MYEHPPDVDRAWEVSCPLDVTLFTVDQSTHSNSFHASLTRTIRPIPVRVLHVGSLPHVQSVRSRKIPNDTTAWTPGNNIMHDNDEFQDWSSVKEILRKTYCFVLHLSSTWTIVHFSFFCAIRLRTIMHIEFTRRRQGLPPPFHPWSAPKLGFPTTIEMCLSLPERFLGEIFQCKYFWETRWAMVFLVRIVYLTRKSDLSHCILSSNILLTPFTTVYSREIQYTIRRNSKI